MPDDLLAAMEQQIALASGGFALLMVMILVVAYGGPPVWTTLLSISTGSGSGAILFAFVSVIALSLGFILVTFRVHDGVDHLVFRASREVENDVVNALRSEVTKAVGPSAIAARGPPPQPTDHELMDLFYEFVDRDDGSWPVLRSIAFDRWTPYHIALNWFMLSVAGVVLASVSLIVRGTLDRFNGGALLFFAIVIVLTVVLSQKVIRPGFVPTVAKPELTKMTKDLRKEFGEIARARFG